MISVGNSSVMQLQQYPQVNDCYQDNLQDEPRYSLLGRLTLGWPNLLFTAATIFAIAGIAYSVFIGMYIATVGFAVLLPITIIANYYLSDYEDLTEINETTKKVQELNDELTEQNEELEQAHEALKATAEQLTSDNEKLEDSTKKLEKDNQTFRDKNQELKRQVRELQKQVQSFHRENTKLTASIEKTNKLVQQLQLQSTAMQHQNEELATQVKKLSDEKAALQKLADLLQDKVNHLDDYIKRIKQETAELAKAHLAMGEHLKVEGGQVDELGKTVAALAGEDTKLKDATENLDHVFGEDMQQFVQMLKKTQGASEQIFTQVSGRCEQLEHDLGDLRGSVGQLEDVEKKRLATAALIKSLENSRMIIRKQLIVVGANLLGTQEKLEKTSADLDAKAKELADVEGTLGDTTTKLTQEREQLAELLKQYQAFEKQFEAEIVAAEEQKSKTFVDEGTQTEATE